LLHPQLNSEERNWTPIVSGSSKKDVIDFIYTVFPSIVGTINLSTGDVRYHSNPQGRCRQEAPFWKWGAISGGTPAIELSNVYVCFFHSYKRVPKFCYTMGACAFSKDSLHQLRAISPYPILTRKMYESNHNGRMGPIEYPNSARNLDRVIFPSGVVLTKDDNGDEIFVVSCGENDLNTRVLVIDKKLLLKSLRPVDANCE
jgi:hypothetical protein